MLHTLNKPLSQPVALQACLRTINAGDALLLIEDGVYCARKAEAQHSGLEQLSYDILLYALKTDVQARGIESHLYERVQLIDYHGFVELSETHAGCQSWY